jgi:putative hydrolase of the HAD superfamily
VSGAVGPANGAGSLPDRGPRSGRAIVFDFGGVLFRWRPVDFVGHVLAHRITPATDATHWARQVFQGYGGEWGHFDRGTIEVPELVRQIAARTGLAEDEVQAIVDAVPDELEIVPATVSWIERLHADGWPLHYLSNMPEPYARHLESHHGVLGRFRSGVFSSRVKRIKPEPELFALAAAHYGRAPSQLLLIDDYAANVEAARAAGWQAIAFRDAAQAEAELRALGW